MPVQIVRCAEIVPCAVSLFATSVLERPGITGRLLRGCEERSVPGLLRISAWSLSPLLSRHPCESFVVAGSVSALMVIPLQFLSGVGTDSSDFVRSHGVLPINGRSAPSIALSYGQCRYRPSSYSRAVYVVWRYFRTLSDIGQLAHGRTIVSRKR